MPLATVRLPHGATLESARRKLNLAEDEVDPTYGLVPLDPDQGLFAVRITDTAAARLGAVTSEADGVFSDPGIEPFGPPT